MPQPDGKRGIIVTGAAGEIGAAIALAFGRTGATVFASDVAAEALTATVDSLRREGVEARAIPGDITNSDDVAKCVDSVSSSGATLDVLVNCAALVGYAAIDNTLTTSPEHWRRVIDVNLSGAFYVSQAAARVMAHRGAGSIIHVSSVAGLRAEENAAAYCAAKAGLLGLTRALALDLARHGVRVNAIAPGWIDTERSREPIVKPTSWFEHETPLGHGRPEDVAGAALYLSSEAGRFVTGATLVVDGGFSIS